MAGVDPTLNWWSAVLSGGGIVAGLTLLVRGLAEYRSTVRLGDTSTSTISSLAAGEVRISGVVEPAELTLVSLLQGAPCVYYRATIGRSGEVSTTDGSFTEERSIGFRVRDRTGSIRIFPRGARVDAPLRLNAATGVMGDEPPGLAIRTGSATRPVEIDRDSAIADLLRVHHPDTGDRPAVLRGGEGLREYHETRLEPGDAVTIVGRAMPFADLADPIAADYGTEADRLDTDPEIAADLAEARLAGALVLDPVDAWGNAAIPGFGIGRPATSPDLDPAAHRLPLATAEETARVEQIFEIEPGALVVASSREVPLLIAYGRPGVVMARSQLRVTIGLLGAVLAIASAMVLAVVLDAGVLS
jgi:hypothetical protein